MSSITPTNFRGSRKHFVSTLLTGQTPLRERRPRPAPALVGEDRQLEHRHPGELDAVVFGLANRLRWPEIPLLPHNLPERAPAVRRPAQHELLRAPRSAGTPLLPAHESRARRESGGAGC